MRYTDEELLREVLRRADAVRSLRDRRQTMALSGAAALIMLTIVVSTVRLIPQLGADLKETAYGASLLPNEAGGYILAGVAAFVCGVILTLVCLRYREKTRREGTARRGRDPDMKPGPDHKEAINDPGTVGRNDSAIHTGKNDSEEAEGEMR